MKVLMNEEFHSGKETPKLNGLVEKAQMNQRLQKFRDQALWNKVNLNHLIRQNKTILKD